MNDKERSLTVTSCLITHHFLEEIRIFVGGGVISAYDKIAELSYEFDREHENVKWGEDDEHDDWESCVWKWVQSKIK